MRTDRSFKSNRAARICNSNLGSAFVDNGSIGWSAHCEFAPTLGLTGINCLACRPFPPLPPRGMDRREGFADRECLIRKPLVPRAPLLKLIDLACRLGARPVIRDLHPRQ